MNGNARKQKGKLVIGVMSDVREPERRARLRDFYRTRFGNLLAKDVRVEFVVSRHLYPNTVVAGKMFAQINGETAKGKYNQQTKSYKQLLEDLHEEDQKEGDIKWVDSSEWSPHVSPETQKSARWYQTHTEAYQYYCKADDDALVNVRQLLHLLEQSGPSALVGNIHFREWHPDYKFQAGGNSWNSRDKKTGFIEKVCKDCVGPLPYAYGGLECLGSTLMDSFAKDTHFESFVQEAVRRDGLGNFCDKTNCATMPWDTHMWHHEDLGIQYNLFRSILRKNLTGVKVVDIVNFFWNGGEQWSSRISTLKNNPVVVVHGVKHVEQFNHYIPGWNTNNELKSTLSCGSCARRQGWKSTTTCLSGEGDNCDAFIEVNPSWTFQCCDVTPGLNMKALFSSWEKLGNVTAVVPGDDSWDNLFLKK